MTIKIFYNESTFRDIMKGHEIADLEQDIMMQKLDEVKAAFFQEYGVPGAFEIQKIDTNSRRSRTTFRIRAADERTGAILKAHPKWLGKFL